MSIKSFSRKTKYFNLARLISLRSNYHHQIGAIIVNKKEIIGLGYNKPTKTHPISKHPYQTIHAEMDAIIGIDRKKLKGADIYVYREFKDGSAALARPCKYCEALLREFGIKTMFYTTDGGYTYERL